MTSLNRYYQPDEEWKEIVVEDRRAGPADVACCRLDFESWLSGLPPKQRTIAKSLAKGESTKATAKRHHVSPGRISQIRRELMARWFAFVGEEEQAMAAATA